MTYWNVSFSKNTVIVALFLLSISAFSQEYKILAKNAEIGTLYINHSETNGKKQVEVKSDVLVKFLGKTKIKYALKNEYLNDFLIQSKVTTYVNDKLHSSSELKEYNDGYEIIKDDHKSYTDSKETYTGAMLYTVEPIGVKYVFSEIDGVKKEIRKIGEHHYELLNPSKKRQTQEYIYENGVLKKGIINHPVITFYLIKK